VCSCGIQISTCVKFSPHLFAVYPFLFFWKYYLWTQIIQLHCLHAILICHIVVHKIDLVTDTYLHYNPSLNNRCLSLPGTKDDIPSLKCWKYKSEEFQILDQTLWVHMKVQNLVLELALMNPNCSYCVTSDPWAYYVLYLNFGMLLGDDLFPLQLSLFLLLLFTFV